LQSIVPPGQSGANGGSASNPTASTSYSSALAASMAQQQSKHGQQSQVQIPTAADISLLLSLGMGGLDASQLANLDLQKLAMYLVSIHFEIRDKSHSRFHFFYYKFVSKFTKTKFLLSNSKLNEMKNWHKRKFNLRTILAMLLAFY
jgi:hypothetical protein